MNTNTQPKAKFPYTMHTTAMMEHSHGIAWTADLYCGTVKVGIVEQMGDGGCDRVLLNNIGYRTHWKAAVASAFGGDEEAATYWLLLQEEAHSMFGDANA